MKRRCGSRRLSKGGVLPVQGPPGAGKTYTGARLICELVAQGAKIGITAASHKVIGNLLELKLSRPPASGTCRSPASRR